MGNIELKKVTATSAQALNATAAMSEDALMLQAGEDAPAAFLEKLIDAELFMDASRFLAAALPGREAVWWACVCCRSLVTDETEAERIKALELAEAWVYGPTDEIRRQAMDVAQAAEMNNPYAWSAMAVFWSGGSIAPQNSPVVPPPEDGCARAVAGAVMLAATHGADPSVANTRYPLFLKQGIAVANGENARLITE